jgi:hypothetical protein
MLGALRNQRSWETADVKNKTRTSFVLWFGMLLGLELFLTIPTVSTFLANRERIPADSFIAQMLSWAYRPVEMVVETAPMTEIVSRDSRHTISSIVNRPEPSP